MKKLGQIFLVGAAVFIPLFAAFCGGYRQGRKDSTAWISVPSMFLSDWTTNAEVVNVQESSNYFTGKPFTEPSVTKDEIIAAYVASRLNDAFNRGVTSGAGCAMILCKTEGHCEISEVAANGIIMQTFKLMARTSDEWPYREWPELRTNRNHDWIGGMPRISSPHTKPTTRDTK